MTHTIDVTKGELVSTVSNQWATRPDDQKFLSLADLRKQVSRWADESTSVELQPKQIEAVYSEDDANYLRLMIGGTPVDATHYAYDQVARMANAPARYLRTLPGPLAATCLNYGLQSADQKAVAAYLRTGGVEPTIRAITSTRYGRIYDRDVVDSVMKVQEAGDWKVPGLIDWQSRTGVKYNPRVDVTKETTTLYASDRDIFLFLVDDLNPIEVGKLANGDPDLMFRGFYVWNSEVGDKSFGIATMYLRGVCQNRNLWGVEGFNEIRFAHTSGAPDRFVAEANPALLAYAHGSTHKVIAGVAAAKNRIVAKTDEERIEFLARFGFSERTSRDLIGISIAEEQRPPESIWDFAQAITASARQETYQDQRIRLEAIAGRLLDKVSA